jgi:kinesin family protein C2/C3
MTAVVDCILALRDRFGSRIGEERGFSFLTRSDSEGSRRHMEAKLQRVLTSPIMSGDNFPVFVLHIVELCNCKFMIMAGSKIIRLGIT